MSDLYLKTGFASLNDLKLLGLIPDNERMEKKRPVAAFECIQEIPCNACLHACIFDAVVMENINAIPKIVFDKCTGCLACIKICPGLAIFMLQIKGNKGYVTMQYEFLPQPKEGDEVFALNREGKTMGRGLVTHILPPERNDGTALVTIEIPKNMILEIRAFKLEKGKI
jgi:ferredoxin